MVICYQNSIIVRLEQNQADQASSDHHLARCLELRRTDRTFHRRSLQFKKVHDIMKSSLIVGENKHKILTTFGNYWFYGRKHYVDMYKPLLELGLVNLVKSALEDSSTPKDRILVYLDELRVLAQTRQQMVPVFIDQGIMKPIIKICQKSDMAIDIKIKSFTVLVLLRKVHFIDSTSTMKHIVTREIFDLLQSFTQPSFWSRNMLTKEFRQSVGTLIFQLYQFNMLLVNKQFSELEEVKQWPTIAQDSFKLALKCYVFWPRECMLLMIFLITSKEEIVREEFKKVVLTETRLLRFFITALNNCSRIQFEFRYFINNFFVKTLKEIDRRLNLFLDKFHLRSIMGLLTNRHLEHSELNVCHLCDPSLVVKAVNHYQRSVVSDAGVFSPYSANLRRNLYAKLQKDQLPAMQDEDMQAFATVFHDLIFMAANSGDPDDDYEDYDYSEDSEDYYGYVDSFGDYYSDEGDYGSDMAGIIEQFTSHDNYVYGTSTDEELNHDDESANAEECHQCLEQLYDQSDIDSHSDTEKQESDEKKDNKNSSSVCMRECKRDHECFHDTKEWTEFQRSASSSNFKPAKEPKRSVDNPPAVPLTKSDCESCNTLDKIPLEDADNLLHLQREMDMPICLIWAQLLQQYRLRDHTKSLHQCLDSLLESDPWPFVNSIEYLQAMQPMLELQKNMGRDPVVDSSMDRVFGHYSAITDRRMELKELQPREAFLKVNSCCLKKVSTYFYRIPE